MQGGCLYSGSWEAIQRKTEKQGPAPRIDTWFVGFFSLMGYLFLILASPV